MTSAINTLTVCVVVRTARLAERIENRIRSAVDIVLYSQGFRYVEAGGEPDFRVSFTAVGEPGLRVDEVSSRLAYGDGTWGPPVAKNTAVPEYTRWDVRANWTSPNGRYTVSAWVSGSSSCA